MQYLSGVFGRAWWQLFQLFAVPFAIAVALQWVGYKIRGRGFGRFGNAYLYFIAPGVACHEAGHAAGCLITGTRILKFVPFTTEYDDKVGYVQHEGKSGLWGGIAYVIIDTGPIWFGCLMIMLLSRLFGGVVSVARYGDFFSNESIPGIVEYVYGLASAAWGLLTALFIDGTWGWGFAVWLYLVFCIASEIGLSMVDIKLMCPGLAMIVGMFFVLNLVPVVGTWVSAGIFVALPWLFRFHVVMLATLMLNVALLIAMRAVLCVRFR